MEIKQSWLERQEKIIGKDSEILKSSIFKQLPSSFRINTLKIRREEAIKRLQEWKLKEVPFFKEGFVLEEKKYAIGNTLEHFLGYIYIQEVASMIPPIVLAPEPGETILDMAAAPGSKTTQIAQIMQNKGSIFANEIKLSRLNSLRANLQRCGVVNTAITNMDGRRFSRIKTKFDKILLDAPCTGSGAAMKSVYKLDTWSVNASRKMASLQKQLVFSAANCLAKNGTIVYSTCSLEPEENEEVIDFAIKKLGFSVEKIKIKNFKTREGTTNWENRELSPELKNTIRIYPQDNNTEGFFVARLVK